MTRRDLIQRVLAGGAVLVLAPSVLQSCTKTDPGGNVPGTPIDLDLSLPENAALNTTGGSMIVQNIIIVNTGGASFIALSSICTHQGCTVGYNSGTGNIQCPCHGSVYATSGSVISGPAPTALRSYAVSKTGNILTITL
ncbi:MAG: twin-arginine translocation signal domain-containing protein [Bacteroidetes bacterium]|nr:MAG: twin-arginine translocation signal domain-containing protein [Bacteroidota bacterium]